MYLSTDVYPLINPATKNNFQRRIMGLVTHYIGATPDYYAKKIVTYIDIPMSEYQEYIYKHYEDIEAKLAKNKRFGKSGSNYMAYTRQSCNFVFPIMGQGFSGETRPRKKDFKNTIVSDKYTSNEITDKSDKLDKINFAQTELLEQKKKLFVNTFDAFLKKKLDADIKNKHTLADDIINFKKTIGKQITIEDYVKFMSNPDKKSDLLLALHNSSAKMTFMILIITTSPGPVLVYSSYVEMEGLQIFKIYLKYLGFTAYVSHDKGSDGYRYMEYHGEIDQNDRKKVLEVFNRSDNKLGEISKIVMISPAGAEGISLNNIRQVHLMEPYWHEVRMHQMIGRAIRNCSHKNLPIEDREVQVFRYKSIKSSVNGQWTADQFIEDAARSKDGLISSFLDAIKEVAIDCALNKAHNNLTGTYRCFQFEEKSLFDDQIGPAYKDDVQDDLFFNNGLNSVNSRIKKIKIIKIKAVIQLVSDENHKADPKTDAERYSEPQDYWFNNESLIVYDIDMQYPIGKIGTNDTDMPLKLDNNTYIITKMIPIPILINN